MGIVQVAGVVFTHERFATALKLERVEFDLSAGPDMYAVRESSPPSELLYLVGHFKAWNGRSDGGIVQGAIDDVRHFANRTKVVLVVQLESCHVTYATGKLVHPSRRVMSDHFVVMVFILPRIDIE